MDKFKLCLYFFLVISIAITIGVLICKENNCCITSNTETNEKNYKENLTKAYYYTTSLIDSIQKQDSVYIENLREIAHFIKTNCKVKTNTHDSHASCICSEKKIYELSQYSYQKIQQKLSILQKNISARNIETHHKLKKFISKDFPEHKIQKNEY